jgi:hypothetical protein
MLAVKLTKQIDGSEMTELRDAACAVVDERKKDGWRPDRIVSRIRAVFRTMSAEADSTWGKLDPREQRALMETVMQWCIERYYVSD